MDCTEWLFILGSLFQVSVKNFNKLVDHLLMLWFATQESHFNKERMICSGSNTWESALTNVDSVLPLPDVKWIPLQLRSKIIIMQRKVI